MTRVFVSYAHSTQEHADRISQLVEALRAREFEVHWDGDVTTPQGPPEGWTQWMRQQIKEAKWVLIVFDAEYRRQLDRRASQSGDGGQGIAFESRIITTEMYRQYGMNERFIPLLANGSPVSLIPSEWVDYTCYRFPSESDKLASNLLPPGHTKRDPTPTPDGIEVGPRTKDNESSGKTATPGDGDDGDSHSQRQGKKKDLFATGLLGLIALVVLAGLGVFLWKPPLQPPPPDRVFFSADTAALDENNGSGAFSPDGRFRVAVGKLGSGSQLQMTSGPAGKRLQIRRDPGTEFFYGILLDVQSGLDSPEHNSWEPYRNGELEVEFVPGADRQRLAVKAEYRTPGSPAWESVPVTSSRDAGRPAPKGERTCWRIPVRSLLPEDRKPGEVSRLTLTETLQGEPAEARSFELVRIVLRAQEVHAP